MITCLYSHYRTWPHSAQRIYNIITFKFWEQVPQSKSFQNLKINLLSIERQNISFMKQNQTWRRGSKSPYQRPVRNYTYYQLKYHKMYSNFNQNTQETTLLLLKKVIITSNRCLTARSFTYCNVPDQNASCQQEIVNENETQCAVSGRWHHSNKNRLLRTSGAVVVER